MASATQAAQFIGQIAPLIQAEAKRRGYKVASPIIAQACLESAFGTSSLGYKYHNYFGIKCGSKWTGKSVNMKTKEEYSVGTLTTIRDNFRVYDNMADGVKGYFDFITAARYANLKDARTPREYLERIKADGYATSSAYIANNMRVVENYGLTKYDGKAPAAPQMSENPYPQPTKLLRKGSKGNDVRWVQYELNRHGAGLTIDGDFGKLTEQAVFNFQKSKNIAADKIVGPQTIAALKS